MATIELETLQITGLQPDMKLLIKQEALKRNMTVSLLLLMGFEEYIKKHPHS